MQGRGARAPWWNARPDNAADAALQLEFCGFVFLWNRGERPRFSNTPYYDIKRRDLQAARRHAAASRSHRQQAETILIHPANCGILCDAEHTARAGPARRLLGDGPRPAQTTARASPPRPKRHAPRAPGRRLAQKCGKPRVIKEKITHVSVAQLDRARAS